MDNNTSTNLVQFGVSTRNKIRQYATESFERWKNKPGWYGNSFNRHYRGKSAEFAVELYLQLNHAKYDSAFKDSNREYECDIVIEAIESIRLDIKSCQRMHWDDLGRAANVGQWSRLKDKADAVVWAVIEPDDSVTLMGYSTIEDIEASQIVTKGDRPQTFRQVDQDKLRPMQGLLNALFVSDL